MAGTDDIIKIGFEYKTGLDKLQRDVNETLGKIKTNYNKVNIEFSGESAEKFQKALSGIVKLLPDLKQGTKGSSTSLNAMNKAFEKLAESASKAAVAKAQYIAASNGLNSASNTTIQSLGVERGLFNSIKERQQRKPNLVNQITALDRTVIPIIEGKDRTNRSSEYLKIVNQLREQMGVLRNTNGKPITVIPDGEVTKIEQAIANVKALIREMRVLQQNPQGTPSSVLGREKLLGQIADWETKNSRAARLHSSELLNLKTILRSAEGGANIPQLTTQFTQLQRQVQETGQTGIRFADAWQNKFKSLITSLTTFMSFYQLVNISRKIVAAVIDVNTQFTELSKVSNIDLSTLENSMSRFARTAKEIGGSLSDTISATADWSRNGYGLAESEELARVALLYKNVGDGVSIDDANASLISTLRGFKLEAKDAESIIDKFNEVANNFPISSAGIGEALKRSSAAFSAANTSLSEGIALITAANSVVQDPTVVGTMYKTLSMRLRSTKSEMEALGEDTEGMVESTSKLRDIVKGMTGFDILKDDNTYKSVYEIILGIGKEWDRLSDVDQAGLLEMLAGKRQGNALAAVFNNLDILENAYKTAENSTGSAMAEQERYEKSVKYSLERLKASGQEFANTFLTSNTLKGIVDGLYALTDGLTKMTNTFGSAYPLVLSLTTAMIGFNKSLTFKMFTDGNGNGAINILRFFKATNVELRNAKSLLSGVVGYFAAASSVRKDTYSHIDGFNAVRQKGDLDNIKAYARNTEDSRLRGYYNSVIRTGSTANMTGYLAHIDRLNSRLQGTGVAAKIGAAGMRLFAGAMEFIAPMAIISGIMFLGKVLSDFVNRAEIASQKAQDLAAEATKSQGEIDKINEGLQTTGSRISELNSKTHLTVIEQSELNHLKQKNKELETELFLKQEIAKIQKEQASKEAEKSLTDKGVLGGKKSKIENAKEQIALFEKMEKEGLDEVTVGYVGGGKTTRAIKRTKEDVKKSAVEMLQELTELNKSLLSDSPQKKEIKKLIEHYQTFIEKNDEIALTKFNEVFNKDKFNKDRGSISQLVAAGNFSADILLKEFPELAKELKKVGFSADDATEQILAMANATEKTQPIKLGNVADTVESINGLKDGFTTLSKIYEDVQNKGGFDFSILSSDAMASFKNYKTEYNDFLTAITTSPNDINKVQSAFNTLTSAWLQGSGALNNLSDANKDAAIAMLKSYGVANAEEVVMATLIRNKINLALATIDLTKNIDQQVDAMRAELQGYGLSNDAITKLTKAYVTAQQNMTEVLGAGVSARMQITQAELEGISNVTEAYNLLAGKHKLATDDTDAETQRNMQVNMAQNNEYGKQAKALIQYAKAKGKIDDILAKNSALMVSAKFNGSTINNKNTKGSKDSSKDPWLEAFGQEYETLKHNMEMDIINTETYYSTLAQLNNKYFKGRVKYLKEFRQYEEEVYKGGEKIYNERFELSKRYIDNRNTYNDWGADSEVEAWKRVQEWTKQYYAKGLISHQKYVELINEYSKNMHNALIAQYQKDKSALDELFNTTKNLVLQENKTKLEALSKELDEYKKLIELRKRELQLLREKQNHTRSLAEKQKAVSKIENELSSIANDNSASAKARRLKLYEDLETAKLNLDDYIAEHEYNTQIKALEDAQRAYEDSLEKRKKELEDFSNDAARIVKATLDKLNGDHSKLLTDLIAWNNKYGTGIEKDITDNWGKATLALERYKSTLGTSDFATIHNHVKDGAANELRNPNRGYNNQTSSPRVYKVGRDWKAPSEAKTGDLIVTGGGVYKVGGGRDSRDKALSELYSPTSNYDDLEEAYRKVRNAVGYATGGINTSTGLAMLHGTNRNTEVIFNSQDAKKLWDMVHTAGNGIELMQKIFNPKLFNSKIPAFDNRTNTEVNITMPINVNGNLDRSTLPRLENVLRDTFKSMGENMLQSGLVRHKTVTV